MAWIHFMGMSPASSSFEMGKNRLFGDLHIGMRFTGEQILVGLRDR